MSKGTVAVSKRQDRKNSGKYSARQLEMIQERAYWIWEAKGKPANSDLDNWREAEAELKGKGLL